jgi:hypothetical protein
MDFLLAPALEVEELFAHEFAALGDDDALKIGIQVCLSSCLPSQGEPVLSASGRKPVNVKPCEHSP